MPSLFSFQFELLGSYAPPRSRAFTALTALDSNGIFLALKLCLELSYLLVFDPILLLKVSNVGPGFLLSFFDSFLSALAASKLAILWRKAGKRRWLLLSLNGSARKGSYRAGRTIVTSGEYPLVAWVLSCQPVRHSRPPTIGVARSSGLTHVQS